jgi:hypothetical protein
VPQLATQTSIKSSDTENSVLKSNPGSKKKMVQIEGDDETTSGSFAFEDVPYTPMIFKDAATKVNRYMTLGQNHGKTIFQRILRCCFDAGAVEKMGNGPTFVHEEAFI